MHPKNSPSLLLLLFAFLLGTTQAYAQCTPAPRVGGTTFAFGVTDSVTPTQFVPGPYIVCDNASLYYYGNNPDTIYLEGSARLHVAFSWNLVVYMRNNSQLKCDTTPALRTFAHVIYDPTFTTFVDTAASTILNLTSCMAMSYDYNAFPGGISPCSTPTSLAARTAPQLDVFPNPVTENLHLRLPANWQDGAVVMIYGMDGRQVGKHFVSGLDPMVDVTTLPPGNYLLRAMHGAAMISRIVEVR